MIGKIFLLRLALLENSLYNIQTRYSVQTVEYVSYKKGFDL